MRWSSQLGLCVTSIVLHHTTLLINSCVTRLLGPDIWHQPSCCCGPNFIHKFVCVCSCGRACVAGNLLNLLLSSLQCVFRDYLHLFYTFISNEQKYEHPKEPQNQQAANRKKNTTHKAHTHRLNLGNLPQFLFPAGAVNATDIRLNIYFMVVVCNINTLYINTPH